MKYEYSVTHVPTGKSLHTHGVWMKGGSIGEKHNKQPMKTFGSHEEAKEYAKRMRKTLSPGEKKDYGLGFEAKPLKKINENFEV